jgi:multiple sugar transport system permease protein
VPSLLRELDTQRGHTLQAGHALTNGGPINSTHLFATLTRQVGLESGQIGQGAAISLYLFPVLAIVVWVQLRFVRRQAY